MGFGREGKSTYHFLKTYTNPSFIAINDSVEIETEEKFYAGWCFVPDEIKNRKIDFFITGKVDSKLNGMVDGIRVYVK